MVMLNYGHLPWSKHGYYCQPWFFHGYDIDGNEDSCQSMGNHGHPWSTRRHFAGMCVGGCIVNFCRVFKLNLLCENGQAGETQIGPL